MSARVQQPISIERGDTYTWKVTAWDEDGARLNLTGATIEFQVKSALGAADPALIAKSVGSGITLLSQVDDATEGQFTIDLVSSDTETRTPGVYWYDVVLIISGKRQHIIPPSKFVIKGVVNNSA